MEIETAQATANVFVHGFSAGTAFGLLFAYLRELIRNWRRDP